MKSMALAAMAATLLISLGCTRSPKSGKGFTLPEGDVAQGKATYERLQCNACHTIKDVEQLASGDEGTPKPIALGGEVYRIRTYGELVTSIINPSHRIAPGYDADEVVEDGNSKMKNYNDVMTVKELNDIVTFLSSEYRLKQIEPTHYPSYAPYL